MERRQVTGFSDFRHGINVDVSPLLLSDSELMVAENVHFEKRGSISRRKGLSLFATVPGKVTQIFEWPRVSGESVLMVVSDQTLLRVTESGHQTVTPVGKDRIPFVPFQDKLYFIDDESFKFYDGADVVPVSPTKYDRDTWWWLPQIFFPTEKINPVDKCSMLVYYPKGYRFFAAGFGDNTSALFYSEPNDPTTWKATSFVVPSEADGPVTGLQLFGDALLVFFRHAVWVWRGIDPKEDVVWERLSAPEGTASPHTLAVTPLSLTFLSDSGIRSLTPAVLGLTGELGLDEEGFANLSSGRVNSILKDIQDRENVMAVYDQRNLRYLLSFDGKVLTYDWGSQGFHTLVGPHVKCLHVTRDGKVLAGVEGAVLEFDSGERDHTPEGDEPIESRIQTPPYDFSLMQPKRFLRLFVTFLHKEGASLPCEVWVDGRKSMEVDIQEHVGPLEGREPSGDIVTARVPLNVNGERIQLRFLAHHDFTVFAWAFEWTPLWRKGVKV